MSALSVDDIRLLEKTKGIREQLIDNLMKSELPTKARDVDSFVNLLESVDRSIVARAKISIDEAANKVNEGTKEVLTELIKSLHSGTPARPTIDGEVVRDIPSFIPSSPVTLNEGETLMGTDHITLDDIKLHQM